MPILIPLALFVVCEVVEVWHRAGEREWKKKRL